MNPQPRHSGSRVLNYRDFVVELMDPNDPQRYNRGVRFTPVAAICQATLGGDEFLFKEAMPDPLTAVAGLFAEFDLISPPPGFTAGKLGEGYVKIGVGVLKKDAATYHFWPQHELIRPAQTTMTGGESTVQFHQVCAPYNGYGYALAATVTVGAGTIVVDWWLQNTGSQPLETQQYAHNCFRFNRQAIGPDYAVSFPYDFQARGLQPEQRQTGRAIQFLAEIPSAVNIEVDYPPDYTGPNSLAVTQVGSGRFATCRTSVKGVRTAIHAAKVYVCPEQFITIRLSPGATAAWARRYAFGVKR